GTGRARLELGRHSPHPADTVEQVRLFDTRPLHAKTEFVDAKGVAVTLQLVPHTSLVADDETILGDLAELERLSPAAGAKAKRAVALVLRHDRLLDLGPGRGVVRPDPAFAAELPHVIQRPAGLAALLLEHVREVSELVERHRPRGQPAVADPRRTAHCRLGGGTDPDRNASFLS